MSHRKVFAAEKYAEGPRPLCPCGCERPMFWQVSAIYTAGGRWTPPRHDHKKSAAYTKQRRETAYAIMDAEAAAKGSRCADCGEPFVRGGPVRFHWHHRDPSAKAFDVTGGHGIHGSRERLRAELAKCDHLCHRCHRWRHADMRSHCPNGHEMVPENIYVSRDGHNHCRQCRRDADLRRWNKRKQRLAHETPFKMP